MPKKGYKQSQEHITNNSEARKGKHYPKMSAAQKGKSHPSMAGENNPAKRLDVRAKSSVAHKDQIPWSKNLTKETDPRIAAMGNARKGKKYPKISAAQKKRFESKAVRDKTSAASKRNWQDPDYVTKQMKATRARPNKAEHLLEEILNKLYPGEFKYVGNRAFWIERKNPDFVNVNGKKQIIELFGNHWHQGEDPQERIDLFAKYGFRTLVIWEREL